MTTIESDRVYYWQPVVKSFLKRLKTAGFKFTSVDYGEDSVAVRSVKSAVDEICAVDYCVLRLENRYGDQRWVSLLLGNGPHEIVCDYAVDKGIDYVTELHEAEWRDKEIPTISKDIYYEKI